MVDKGLSHSKCARFIQSVHSLYKVRKVRTSSWTVSVLEMESFGGFFINKCLLFVLSHQTRTFALWALWSLTIMLSYFVVQFFPFVFENTHISIELVAIIICFSMVLHNPRNKNAKKRVKKKTCHILNKSWQLKM